MRTNRQAASENLASIRETEYRTPPETGHRVLMQTIDFNLYLVTDRNGTSGRDLLWVLHEALEGGVKAIQLREKDLGGRDLMSLAREVKQLCDGYRAELFINDRVDVAMAAHCHVHLPGNSIPIEVVRGLVSPATKIGVSTHQLEEVRNAAQSGADFVLFGPIYATPSKSPYGDPQGVAALKKILASVSIPVFAIGGIKVDQIPELSEHGAKRIALISAILQAPDPRSATQEILQALAG
jgi:thiamine-phosphate pyrophosphorylase